MLSFESELDRTDMAQFLIPDAFDLTPSSLDPSAFPTLNSIAIHNHNGSPSHYSPIHHNASPPPSSDASGASAFSSPASFTGTDNAASPSSPPMFPHMSSDAFGMDSLGFTDGAFFGGINELSNLPNGFDYTSGTGGGDMYTQGFGMGIDGLGLGLDLDSPMEWKDPTSSAALDAQQQNYQQYQQDIQGQTMTTSTDPLFLPLPSSSSPTFPLISTGMGFGRMLQQVPPLSVSPRDLELASSVGMGATSSSVPAHTPAWATNLFGNNASSDGSGQAQAQAQGHGRSASDACVPTFTSLGFTNEQQHQNGPHSSIPIPIPASSVPNNGSNVSPT